MSKLFRANRGVHIIRIGGAVALGTMLCAACTSALAAASGKCKLAKIVEFPVTMEGMAPETTAKINGTDVKFVVDSGSFYSSLDAGSAASLGLRVVPAPVIFYEDAVGGRVSLSIATVSEFALPGLTLHNLQFVVGGSSLGGQAVGVLGRNILQVADAEYDLSAGIIRIMKAEDCDDTVMAYWLHPGDSYSVIKTIKTDSSLMTGSHIITKQSFRHPVEAMVYVNGVAVRALFDTGASTSFLAQNVAEKAGIKSDSPGAVPGGVALGFGRSTVDTYVAPVSVFKIGDEEVRNTRLRVGKTELGDFGMLIGADFFLSHHVYVANSQDKLYFSYNGGAVFNLAVQPAPASAPPAAPPAAQAPARNSVDDGEKAPSEAKAAAGNEPAGDGSEYARRGAALKARQEFDQALQALNRACELAPDNADYFYQRALLYEELKRPRPALADFDRTIQLDPTHLAALLTRAGYRTRSGDKTGAGADLDAANAALPKGDNERLTLASEYLNLDLFQQAVQQYDLWSVSHDRDVRLPLAFEGRCRARALADVDLRLGLKDCDAALRHAAKASPFYAEASGTRALLLLRLGDYDKSIADYDASLKIAPKNAFALYGRGIDELRKQKTAQGQGDIAQAVALAPKIADNFSRHGIVP